MFFFGFGLCLQLVWHNLVAYLFLYYTLSLVYRFALDEGGKVSITKKHDFCLIARRFFRESVRDLEHVAFKLASIFPL
jgi:hypothetical protein